MKPPVGSVIMQDPSLGAPLCVVLCGAIYDGTRITENGTPNMILFTDPVSRIALALPETLISIGTVWRAIEQARKEKQP